MFTKQLIITIGVTAACAPNPGGSGHDADLEQMTGELAACPAVIENNEFGVADLVAHGDSLFFQEFGDPVWPGFNYTRLKKNGQGKIYLGHVYPDGGPIAVDDHCLYTTGGFGPMRFLDRLPIDGSHPSGHFGGHPPYSFLVPDGAGVYYVTDPFYSGKRAMLEYVSNTRDPPYSDDIIQTDEIDGGAYAMAIDDHYVYWSSIESVVDGHITGWKVKRLPRARPADLGDPPLAREVAESIVIPGHPNEIRTLVAANDVVCALTITGNESQWYCAADGGPPILVQSYVDAGVSDATMRDGYLISLVIPRTLLGPFTTEVQRVAVGGGPIETLFTIPGLARWFALDGEDLYVTVGQDSDGKQTKILRYPLAGCPHE